MADFYSTDEFKAVAKRRLPKMMFDFIEGGAGKELAITRNESALDDVLLQPRVMVNVEQRDLSTSLFGKTWKLPIGIAPMGMCNLVWPDTDRMFANAATRADIPIALSTAASTSIEDMHEYAGANAWFQVYVSQTDDLTFNMIERAKTAGYEVLVFTVDVPQVSPRVRDLRNGFGPKPKMGVRQIADFAMHPRWSLSTLRAGVPEPVNFPKDGGFVREASRARVDWAYLDRVREAWPGKLVVKGVLSPDDAKQIQNAGADGVYVSNHGGRQLDSAPASISMLPRVREAVGEDYPLIFDGGVRSGEHVIKALASGADFVMTGRPFMYAAGADGERGVDSLLSLMALQMDVTMAQLGKRAISEIDATCLIHN